jgi:hypothetical protein
LIGDNIGYDVGNFQIGEDADIRLFSQSSELPIELTDQGVNPPTLQIVFLSNSEHTDLEGNLSKFIEELRHQNNLSIRNLIFVFLCRYDTSSFILNKLLRNDDLFDILKCTSIKWQGIFHHYYNSANDYPYKQNEWLKVKLTPKTKSLIFEDCCLAGLELEMPMSDITSKKLSLNEIKFIGRIKLKNIVISGINAKSFKSDDLQINYSKSNFSSTIGWDYEIVSKGSKIINITLFKQPNLPRSSNSSQQKSFCCGDSF